MPIIALDRPGPTGTLPPRRGRCARHRDHRIFQRRSASDVTLQGRLVDHDGAASRRRPAAGPCPQTRARPSSPAARCHRGACPTCRSASGLDSAGSTIASAVKSLITSSAPNPDCAQLLDGNCSRGWSCAQIADHRVGVPIHQRGKRLVRIEASASRPQRRAMVGAGVAVQLRWRLARRSQPAKRALGAADVAQRARVAGGDRVRTDQAGAMVFVVKARRVWAVSKLRAERRRVGKHPVTGQCSQTALRWQSEFSADISCLSLSGLNPHGGRQLTGANHLFTLCGTTTKVRPSQTCNNV